MKMRKLISILTSLALVFSMTAAITVSVYADGVNEVPALKSAVQQTQPKCPDKIWINGKELNSTKQYYYSNDAQSNAPGSAVNSYAQYKDGRLLLHNFELTSNEDNTAAISTVAKDYIKTESSFNTLYIDLEGTNKITMGADKLNSTIFAPDEEVIISAKDNSAKLELTSNDSKPEKRTVTNDETNSLYNDSIQEFNNTSCIYSGGFQLLSGNVVIDGGKSSVLYIDDDYYWGDVGIYAYKGFINISGGSLEVKDTFCAMYSDYNTNISGGALNIKDCSWGIDCNYDTNITGGNLSLDSTVAPIYSYNNINISGGNIVIDDLAEAKYEMTAKTVYPTGIDSHGSLNISGGNIEIANIEKENSIKRITYGVWTYDGLRMTNGRLSISGVQYGISTYYNIDISNSTIDITAHSQCMFSSYMQPTIKNSDVKLLSTGTDKASLALWSNPKVSGTPAIYAGETKNTAKRVAAGTNLSTYKFVHIYKNSSVIMSSLTNVFKGLVTSIFGLNSGSTNNSVLWQYFETFFKLL